MLGYDVIAGKFHEGSELSKVTPVSQGDTARTIDFDDILVVLAHLDDDASTLPPLGMVAH